MKTVRTKAYTMSLLLTELANLSRTTTTYKELVTQLAPRAGANGVKILVLNRYLGGSLKQFVTGERGVAKTAKSRVIAALRTRKNYGPF